MKSNRGQEFRKVFYELSSTVDTPRSLGLWLRFCYAHDELAEASIDPLDYDNDLSFFRDYAVLSFVSKYRDLDTTHDLRERALSDFALSEEKCLVTNERWRSYRRLGYGSRSELIFRVQKTIEKILGRFTLDKAFDRSSWGPGSTSSISRRRASVRSKMSQFPFSLTPTAVPYMQHAIREDYAWLHALGIPAGGPVSLAPCCFSIVESNKLTTVPKNAKTDRVIASEPTCNMFLQKGIGNYIRDRLMRFGVNLNDQSRNQHLAAQANVAELATLDLKAASDTVAKEVVYQLLPYRWYRTLMDLRSPSGTIRHGDTIVYEKFSSMGNGYTFELESLIFYAIVRAVYEENGISDLSSIGIYGDDIICKASLAYQVIDLLEYCGFSTNVKKSHIQGRFFESCGKHYYDGIDVTPMYQKEPLTNVIAKMRCMNRVFSLGLRDPLFFRAWKRLIGHNFFSRLQRFSVPPGLEVDGTLWAFDFPMIRRNQNFYFKKLGPRIIRKHLANPVYEYAYTLRINRYMDYQGSHASYETKKLEIRKCKVPESLVLELITSLQRKL